MTEFFQSFGMNYEWAWFVATVSGILLIAFPVMLAVAMIIYMDRKVLGAIMLRRGPNVVGGNDGDRPADRALEGAS